MKTFSAYWMCLGTVLFSSIAWADDSQCEIHLYGGPEGSASTSLDVLSGNITQYAGKFYNLSFSVSDDCNAAAVQVQSVSTSSAGKVLVREGGSQFAGTYTIDTATLQLDGSGNWLLPSFTYQDAGTVSLELIFLNGRGERIINSNTVKFAYSPYAIAMEIVDPVCPDDSECAKLPILANGENFLAGDEFSVKYLAKGWCSSISGSGSAVGMSSLESCSTLPSYEYTSGSKIIALAYNEQDPDSNYLVPGEFYFNRRTEDGTGGSATADGSTERASYIKDVGRYTLKIKSYTDGKTGLEVRESVYDRNDFKVAPYYFEISPLSSSAVAEIPNSCQSNDENHRSFTYFGQPVSPEISISARNKQGDITSFFDYEYYKTDAENHGEVNIFDRYQLEFNAFTRDAVNGYTLLKHDDGSSRLVECSWCSAGNTSEFWKGGVLNLNGENYPLVSLSTGYLVRIMAKNYTDDPAREVSTGSTVIAYEGKSALTSYRDEAPVLRNGTGTDIRFYAFLGLSMRELSAGGTAYLSRDIRSDPASVRMTEEMVDNADYVHSKAVIFSGSPLELRMGRLVLSNSRSGRDDYLYMPVRAEYYRKVYNGDRLVSDGWILNTDDSCSLLSRGNFFLEPSGKTDRRIFLRDSSQIGFSDDAVSTSALVNEKNSGASAGDLTAANHGMWYLRISRPNGDASQIFFTLRILSAGRGYDFSSSGYASSVTLVRDTGAGSGFDERLVSPVWFGTSLEGIDQAFGAFRSWPGSDRILSQFQSLP
ncbi:MAG: DUF6701 domain-containing protein [Succinivibrionaceae bacterium]